MDDFLRRGDVALAATAFAVALAVFLAAVAAGAAFVAFAALIIALAAFVATLLVFCRAAGVVSNAFGDIGRLVGGLQLIVFSRGYLNIAVFALAAALARIGLLLGSGLLGLQAKCWCMICMMSRGGRIR